MGMEATGHSRWFEPLLAELVFGLWIGDPAEIKTKAESRKQKTDREDGRLPCWGCFWKIAFLERLDTESVESGSAAIALAPA